MRIYMYQRLDPDRPNAKHWPKMLFKFGKIAEWLIFSIILSALMIVASPYLPTKNLFTSFIVTSGSMSPAIKSGSVALVLPIDPVLVREKDIIAFYSPEDKSKTILHRVERIKVLQGNRLYLTKGDNNREADKWEVPASMVRGLWFFSIPYLGFLASAIRTPAGFLVFIGLPGLLLIIWQIREIMSGFDELARKRAYNLTGIFIASVLAGFTFSPFFVRQITALFSSASIVSGVSISSKDYASPASPDLISPADNIVRETDGLVMDWSDVSDWQNMSPPVYYIYQSALNSAFSPLAYQSGKLSASQIPAPGTPDGNYWWRVKACDNLNNCSASSSVWKGTVDSRPPLLSAGLSDDGLNVSYTASQLSRFVSYTYSLTYDTDSLPQGYAGSVILTGQSEDSKGFYLGTCSGSDCTPHSGIQNIKLSLDVVSMTGKLYHLEISL